MPPKNSGKRRDEFTYNAAGTKITCKICDDDNWIVVGSAPGHLGSEMHKRAVAAEAGRLRMRQQLQLEREGNMQVLEEVNVLPLPNIAGPIGGAVGASRLRSDAEDAMWAEFDSSTVDLSFGINLEATKRACAMARLREDATSFGLLDPEGTVRKMGFGGEEVGGVVGDEEDDFLADLLPQIDFNDEINVPGAPPPQPDSAWFPYPSQLASLLDVLDNFPRLRVSSSLMRVILWVLKQAKCQDPVPSYDAFRKMQATIRAQSGIPTVPCVSVQGNVFHLNDPRSIIAQDFMNPTTRSLMKYYPEVPRDGIIREFWHAEKLLKDDNLLGILSPMYDAGRCHFYVDEVCQHRDGRFLIPIRWVIEDDEVCADFLPVDIIDGKASVGLQDKNRVRAVDLVTDFLDLQDKDRLPHWDDAALEAGYPARMPNPKRAIAGGDPLYCVLVDLFADDVSGNRSKSWNKHNNLYMTNRSLPRKLLQQEYHVHFVSTSQTASVAEQYREFKILVESTHDDPIRAQDESGKKIRVCIQVNTNPSDNPMASEICGHIGGQGNYPCRKCLVGGSKKEKATDEGFHSFFETGTPRTRDGILQELDKQMNLACAGAPNPIQAMQKRTGVKDSYTQYWINDMVTRFKQMQKQNPNRAAADIQRELEQWTLDNKDTITNPFFCTNGLDPIKDTPIEILHTILLGITKYVWHGSHKSMSPEQKKIYITRLQATDTHGLSIPPIRSNYIMQYAGSLIGRQLKILVQTSAFHMHDLLDPDRYIAWKAVGELAALLWFPEIRDQAQYCLDVETAVANVLDIFATLDASKIIAKIKCHLLVHIVDDVVRFGPLVGFATENFESFNAIFRNCSILSNHLAPSRDIAKQLARQEGLKHILTGGYWLAEGDQLTRAGAGVRGLIASHPILQRLLGWTETKEVRSGDVKPLALKKGKEREKLKLGSTVAIDAINLGQYDQESLWVGCKSMISESLDECEVGSWVFAQCPINAENIICGRIHAIMHDATNVDRSIAILELFEIPTQRDEIRGMPVLVRKNSRVVYSIVPTKDVKFDFNVQHDCINAGCKATGSRAVVQERVQTTLTEDCIEHQPLDRFMVNSTAFHNAHLIRTTIPREVIAPTLLFPNRLTTHTALATALRARPKTKSKKRKRSEAEDDGTAVPGETPVSNLEDDEEPPRKKRAPGRQRGAVRASAATVTDFDGERLPWKSGSAGPKRRIVRHSNPVLSLSANRPKRIITKSRRLEESEMYAEVAQSKSDSEESESDSEDDSETWEGSGSDDEYCDDI